MRAHRSMFRHVGSATVWAWTCWALVLGQCPLVANPADPQVIRGSVGFDDAVSGHLRIHQGSDRAVIDWGSFSIAPGEITEFLQPGVRSAVLNQVRGNGASLLEGSLTANGNVFLLNPNGVVLGRSGRVDAAGFVASTLDVDDDAFWSGGDLEFRGESAAAVVNLGQIEAADGDVFLIGASVRNEGFIRAPKGTVGLAAGNDVLLKAAGSGDERVFVRGASGGKKAVGVENRGVIEANQAELKAHGGNVYALAVRNEGRIAATGVTKTGGRILLRANGGRIESVGTLRARRSGGGGGEIAVTGKDIRVGAGARLEADGSDGKSGGTVEVIAEDRLDFGGVASARGSDSGGDGGFVELSGKRELHVEDLVLQADVGAPAGRAGTLFLDPIDISILDGSGGGVSGTLIYDGAIVDYLTSGNLVIGTSSGTGGNGDITVDSVADISWNTGHDLTFLADRDFRMNPSSRIQATGSGDFTVTAARGIEVGVGASISTAEGDVMLSANQQAVPTTGIFHGVRIDGGTVQSTGGGNVTVLGKGGSTGTASGVILQDSGKILGGTTGLVTVTGVGASANAGNGLALAGAGTRIGSAGADVELRGTASGTNARGVFLGDGAVISTLGAGSLAVTGIGASAGGFSEGIFLNGAVSAVSVSTADGNVLFHGTGGGDGTGGNNQGVRIDGNGSSVFAGGSGTLTVMGFGGAAGTGNQNEGVTVVNANLGSAAGAVAVTGTGGGAGASTGNQGVRIGGATGSMTSGGHLAITGTGGANSGNFGIDLSSPVGVSGGGVTLVGDGINLGSMTAVDAGTDIAELRPLTGGFAVDLGGVDVAGTALGLTDAELARITAGTVRIGSAATGDVTVTSPLAPGTNLALVSGGDIVFQNGVTMAAGRNLSADGQDIRLDGALADLSVDGAGTISLDARRTLSLGPGSSVQSASGNIWLFANQGAPNSTEAAAGVVLDGATVTSVDGSLLFAAIAGAEPASDGQRGVHIRGGSLVESTGSGDVILSGIGGAGANDNVGTEITGAGTVVRTASGRLYVEGSGNAAATGTGNDGVRFGAGTVFESVSGGNVELNGLAGGGTGALAIRGESGTGRIAGTGLMMVTSHGGGVTLGQAVQADELLVRAQAGSVAFDLDHAGNDVHTIAVGGDVAVGSLRFRDANGFTVGTVGTASGIQADGDVILRGGATGTVTVAEAVGSDVGGIEISGWDVSLGADVAVGTGSTGEIGIQAGRSFSLGAGKQVLQSGSGGVGIGAGRSIRLESGSVVSTVGGGILMEANVLGTLWTGGFTGIELSGATVQSISGNLEFIGNGSGDPGIAAQSGIRVGAGSLIETGLGGALSLTGTGGAGFGGSIGVEILGVGTEIRTGAGDLEITGSGAAGASGTGNDGILIGAGAVLESDFGNIFLDGAVGGGAWALAIRGESGAGSIAGTGLVMVTSRGGGVTLDQAVQADELLVRAQAGNVAFDLDHAGNDVHTLAVGGDAAVGSLRFRDADGFTVGTVGTVGTANGIQADGDVVLTGGGSGTVTVAEAVGSDVGGIQISGWDVSLGADVAVGAGSTGEVEIQAGRSFSLGAGKQVLQSGSGGIGIGAGRSIYLGSGSVVSTVGGGILMEANVLGTPWTGGFTGIELSGATVQSTSGNLEFIGNGSGDPGIAAQSGIRVVAGSRIEAGVGGGVSFAGNGGAGSGGSIGVEILGLGTEVRTGAGDLEITGSGAAGAIGTGNDGIRIGAGAVLESVSGGNVELNGLAGGGTGALAIRGEIPGSLLAAGDESITLISRGGDVTVAGMVRAGRLQLRDETGSDAAGFRLLNPGNEIDVLTTTGNGPLGAVGSVNVRDADELALGASFGESGTGIEVAGNLKVSAPDRLTVDWSTTAGGDVRLVSNDLRIQAPLASTGGRVVGLVDDLGTGAGGTITVDAPVSGDLGIRFGGGPGTGNDRFFMNLPLAPDTMLFGNGGIDIVDFRGAADPVELNLSQITMRGVEWVIGSPQMDRVIGPTAGASFVLSGQDAFRWGSTNFVRFENLTGGPGNDVFAVATAGRLSGTLDGGGGRNGVTYAGHQGPVTVDLGQGIATGIASLASIQAFHGSPQLRDVLVGTAAEDTFTVLADNAGTAGAISFFSFENLRGGAGNDVFLFRNQATVAGGVDGQEGNGDLLVINDANLTGPQTYDITANTISRNPVYRFVGVEGFVIVSGSGPDVFQTRFRPFSQFYSGGAGNDVLRVADASTTSSPLTRPPSGDIGFVAIEDVVAGAAIGSDAGQILQTETTEVAGNQVGAGGGRGDLTVTDNFNGGIAGGAGGAGGLATLAAGIGAAALGGTVGGNAALPGVVGLLFASDRVTAENSWDLSGAVSLSGGSITVQGLEEIARQVSFNAELELNAAAGGQAKATAGQGDGAVAVAGDGPVDVGTGSSLNQGMALDAEGELLGALGRNLVIDLGDGPVGMEGFGLPGDPGVLGNLNVQTGPAAFSGLSQAIGGDGTAPTGPGDGTVDLGLAGAAPGPGGTQSLQSNSDALTKNELEGALNGL